MSWINDTKPSGGTISNDFNSYVAWDSSIIAWDDAYVSWDNADEYTNDTKPSGSWTNDIKP